MFNQILSNILFNALRFEAKKVFGQYLLDVSDPYACQTKCLLEKLKRSAKSDFGKKYKFDSITHIGKFRETVPISSYSDLKPYIDRVVGGDVSALFNPGEKVIMYALTSGTTDKFKYVPVTKSFLREYKRGSLLWGLQMFVDHPDFLRYKILAIVSPFDEIKTDNNVPCGSISGLVAATQKYLARMMYTIPYWVYAISDAEVKYYTLLRVAVAERGIGLITTANPSTLIKLAQYADKYKETLIKDIHDGTFHFKSDFINRNIRGLDKNLLKNPERAGELEAILKTESHFYPKSFWKTTQVIATWKGGVLSHYIDLLPQYYGDVVIRDLGLIASEGRMSIPYTDDGCGGVLDISSNFFEFIPEDDYSGERYQKTYLAHELEKGKNYYLVLTNSAGFFRYDINDVVKVDGFYELTPIVSFLNKGKHISSMTGEKVSEHQVINAMRYTLSDLGLRIEEFSVSPTMEGNPHYVVAIENDGSLNTTTIERFISRFDHHLMELNCEYLNKRVTKRLDTPSVAIIKEGSFEQIKRNKISQRKGRSEQYKHIYLNPQIDYHKQLDVLSEINT